MAAPAGAVHRQVGPARTHPRRGAERAAVGAGPVVRRRNHADAPGARRRAGHRRRAARAHRAGRQPGRSHLHRPARLPARRVTASSAASGCWPPTSRAGPASICSAAPPTRCSTSARRWICADARASTSTAPTRDRASRRWSPSPPRSTTSSAHTTWRRACANCGCSPRTPRRTTAGRSSRSGGGGSC